jgi:hypothetical protein
MWGEEDTVMRLDVICNVERTVRPLEKESETENTYNNETSFC